MEPVHQILTASQMLLAAYDPLTLLAWLGAVIAALLAGVLIGWEIGRRG